MVRIERDASASDRSRLSFSAEWERCSDMEEADCSNERRACKLCTPVSLPNASASRFFACSDIPSHQQPVLCGKQLRIVSLLILFDCTINQNVGHHAFLPEIVPGWRQPVRSRDAQTRPARKIDDLLHRPLTETLRSDDFCTLIILKGSRGDLRCACRSPVDEDNERNIGEDRGTIHPIHLRSRIAPCNRHDHA